MRRLISHAEDRGRIPVLTATRSLGRVRGLKAAFPGLHLMLYRNLFQQWCSFTVQAFYGNPYFIDRVAEIIRLNLHDAILRELSSIFSIKQPSVHDPNSFYMFIFLHLHIYVQAAGAADFIIDLNRMATDPNHRDDVERLVADQGVRIDLSGVRNSIGFSLCRLGSTADVEERLKVIGDIVIDHAPDEAGRVCGMKVLAEFIEEYARHEFQAGGIRSVLLGSKGMIVERDNLRAERDAARIERDKACLAREWAESERDDLRVERDAAIDDRDTAVAGLDAMRQERDNAGTERDHLRVERDGASAERDAACEQAKRHASDAEDLRRQSERLLLQQTALREWALANRDRSGSFVRRLTSPWRSRLRGQVNQQVYWRRKGDRARDAHDWLKASCAYERYLAIAPSDHAIWAQYGHVLKESGNLPRALVAYERSRQLDPKDHEVDIHLSLLWQRICLLGGKP